MLLGENLFSYPPSPDTNILDTLYGQFCDDLHFRHCYSETCL